MSVKLHSVSAAAAAVTVLYKRFFSSFLCMPVLLLLLPFCPGACQKSSSSASSEASETCQSVSECNSPTSVSSGSATGLCSGGPEVKLEFPILFWDPPAPGEELMRATNLLGGRCLALASCPSVGLDAFCFLTSLGSSVPSHDPGLHGPEALQSPAGGEPTLPLAGTATQSCFLDFQETKAPSLRGAWSNQAGGPGRSLLGEDVPATGRMQSLPFGLQAQGPSRHLPPPGL